MTNDKNITELNLSYRNINKPTDVLTFSYDEDLLKKESNFKEMPDAEIYISLDTAQKQAVKNVISIRDELTVLLIHGILHSYGFDHEKSETEKEIMKEKELFLLKKLSKEKINSLIN
ncbi:MAG: rRNA maturation RNase YbeY [Spirochaetia bacterium]|nr:rRNA maturation RNase YbeY [Spirochaetia bacterium]